MNKTDLINKLTRIYPYSRDWFLKQKEKVLYAMLTSYKPKNNIEEPHIRTKVEDGTSYILSDSGIWEEVQD